MHNVLVKLTLRRENMSGTATNLGFQIPPDTTETQIELLFRELARSAIAALRNDFLLKSLQRK